MHTRYGFPTSTPEMQGLSSRAILGFIEEIEREHIDLQGLIIMRHGQIIADGYWAPFSSDKPHRMFSSRKALIGAAVLLAIQEKLLDLETRVLDIFPDKAPSYPGDSLKELNYYHMLTMTCGHAVDSFDAMLVPGADRPAVFLAQEFRYKPGTHFLYDNGIPDMLCQTIYRLTGKIILEYLRPRLFEPLGVESFCAYTDNPLTAGTTLCCSTPDLFRLTLLYYQGGKWQGKQILDEKLARMAGSYLVPSLQDPEPPSVAYDTRFGYGFQIWRNSVGGFRIDGGQGQFGIGIPEMGLVASMNSDEGDQNIIPVTFWKHITNKLYDRPLKEDREASSALEQKLQALTWAPGENETHVAPFEAQYLFSRPMLGCERLRFQYADHMAKLTTVRGTKTVELLLGAPGSWARGEAPFIFPEMTEDVTVINKTIPGFNRSEIYSTGHWISDNKLEISFRSDAWVSSYVITLEFKNNDLIATYEDGITYSMRHRSPLCQPPKVETRQQLIQEVYAAVKINQE